MDKGTREKRKSPVGGSKIKRALQEAFYDEITPLCGGIKVLKSARFLLGVSGGVDSMVLLELMASVTTPQQLVVAYFDHRLRKNTAKEKKLIQSRCKKLGIKIVLLGTRSGKEVSENAMRNERHRFLEASRLQTQSDFTVLAHHADDQCETFFMRLIRGTGAEGLSGISRKAGKILRPLLVFPKDELIRYALLKNIAYIEDESNQSDQFLRNRIRNQLLPLVSEVGRDFGGRRQLVRRVSELTYELQLINRQRKKWALNWLSTNVVATSFWWNFSQDQWRKLTWDKKQIVLRLLWRKLTGESLLVQNIRQLEESISHKKSVTLPGNVQVSFSQGQVYFQGTQHRSALKKTKNNILLFCCKKKDLLGLSKELDELGAELRVLAPGDRLKNKKLKKITQELGMGRLQRALLPVIARKGTHELLWFFSMPNPMSYSIQAPWEKRRLVFGAKSR